MNSDQKRKLNIGMIVFFIIGSGLSLALTAYVVKSSQSFEIDTTEALGSRLRNECFSSLRLAGMDVTMEGASLLAESQGLTDPYATITKNSSAISQCKGFVLKEYCMGTGCDKAPVSFTLEAAYQ